MDSAGSKMQPRAAWFGSWVALWALCALCLAGAPLRAGHLPEVRDLLAVDGLGYRCLPEAAEPLARASGAASWTLPQRCIPDRCANLDKPALAVYLRARPTPAAWAEYRGRYHAQCHRRDWRPARARVTVADLSAIPDRCVVTGRLRPLSGPRPLLVSPGGAERVYPADWRPRQIIPPARWRAHPQFATALRLMPTQALNWRRGSPQGPDRAIWAVPPKAGAGSALRHVGFDDAGCPNAAMPVTAHLAAPPTIAPPLTPVPLPGGALHLIAGLGALALLRRWGLHRSARRV